MTSSHKTDDGAGAVEISVSQPAGAAIQPEFLRLPKPGRLCPLTGLARSAINELILPTSRNGFKPPVRSFSLRKPGARFGIRLVDYASLRAYILAHDAALSPKGEGPEGSGVRVEGGAR